MVMPNDHTPNPSSIPPNMSELLSKLLGGVINFPSGSQAAGQVPPPPGMPAGLPPDHSSRPLAENVRLVSYVAQIRAIVSEDMAKLSKCNCPSCKLLLLHDRAHYVILGQALKSIYSGNNSKLEDLATYLEAM